MFRATAQQLTDSLIKNGYGKNEDKDIIVYGLTSTMDILFNLITSFIIGMSLHMVLETLIFILSFSPIRTYAGGYHASTPQKCYVLSIGMFTTALLTLKYAEFTPISYLGIFVISCFIILILSPQQDINKPLDGLEVKVYRKRALILLLINIIAFIIFLILSLPSIHNTIAISLLVVGLSLITGKIKNLHLSTKAKV